MADRASAIIVSKRHLLLIHRIRADRDYYVFPGGGVEDGESNEEALFREVLEETGLRVAWSQPAFDHPLPTRLAHYFFVQVESGQMTLGGPEALKQSSKNRYHLEWVPIRQLGQVNLQPEAVRDALIKVVEPPRHILEARELALHQKQLQELLAQKQ